MLISSPLVYTYMPMLHVISIRNITLCICGRLSNGKKMSKVQRDGDILSGRRSLYEFTKCVFYCLDWSGLSCCDLLVDFDGYTIHSCMLWIHFNDKICFTFVIICVPIFKSITLLVPLCVQIKVDKICLNICIRIWVMSHKSIRRSETSVSNF